MDPKKVKDMLKNVNKLKDTKFKEAIMKACCELFYDDEQTFLKELDENTNLIGFKNGVYDLKKNKNNFRPGRPEDRLSFSTKINYIPLNSNNFNQQIIIEEIENFIEKILPEDDVREYTLTLLSSFLNGSTKNEHFHRIFESDFGMRIWNLEKNACFAHFRAYNRIGVSYDPNFFTSV